VVEDAQRREVSKMVCRMEERERSIYRVQGCPRGAGEVDHGYSVWSCEGARECAREVADIMAILVSVTARRKVV
jgi:hypothetical protein